VPHEEIDGVVAVTPLAEIAGLPVGEDPARLFIKTRESRRPVAVPRGEIIALRRRAVPPDVVYGPDERLDLRAAAEGARDYWAWRKLGDVAAVLRLPHRAAEYYLKAADADPTRRTEMESLAAACRATSKDLLLEAIRDEADRCEYAQAITMAGRLEASSALIDRLKSEREEFELRREEFLARKVPAHFRVERAGMIARYAAARSLATAKEGAVSLDVRVCSVLASRLKSTPDQIRAAWNRRGREVRTLRRPPLDQAGWEQAGDSERREWLEAEYAAGSAFVSRVLDDRGFVVHYW
jgi:hypothetical protein